MKGDEGRGREVGYQKNQLKELHILKILNKKYEKIATRIDIIY